jgi:hypothetical protein
MLQFLISMGLITRGLPRVVIPAKAGIQETKLDAGSLAQTVIKSTFVLKFYRYIQL